MLPWLQREYIKQKFGDYLPLSNHEDDLPYDVDHIVPFANWGWNWGSVQRKFFDGMIDEDLAIMHESRHVLGNSIGNLQLLASSENRRAQDHDWTCKPITLPASMEIDLWSHVSRPTRGDGQKWSEDRRIAFQLAVEYRAAWLYKALFEELGYGAWIGADGVPESA